MNDAAWVPFADGSGARNVETGQIRANVKGVNGHPDFVVETLRPVPDTIYWRLQHATLVSILGPAALVAEAERRDGNGVCANRVVLRRWIPHGVTGWRTSPDAPWRPMAELPPEWAAALGG